MNRLSLCSLLGKCCVERILTLPKSDPAREGLAGPAREGCPRDRADAGQRRGPGGREVAGHAGPGERPDRPRPSGACTRPTSRSRRPILRSSGTRSSRRPWRRSSQSSAETGAVIDFLGTALGLGDRLHEARAPCWTTAMRFCGPARMTRCSTSSASSEERFGGNDRSRVLRVKALIAKGTLPEAEQEIARLKPERPEHGRAPSGSDPGPGQPVAGHAAPAGGSRTVPDVPTR